MSDAREVTPAARIAVWDPVARYGHWLLVAAFCHAEWHVLAGRQVAGRSILDGHREAARAATSSGHAEPSERAADIGST